MQLKEHRAFLVDFVMRYADGGMGRWEFDLDYSGYVIEHYGAFEAESPRLAKKFANTVDNTYSNYSWMNDEAFRQAILYSLNDFLGVAPITDIF